MNFTIGPVLLRKPEVKDLDALYAQKNDPEIASLLGGFTTGYSQADLREWIEFHRKRNDERLWVIADAKDDRCMGHVGFYKIDFRVRSAEFAIMLGEKRAWSKGLGKKISYFTINYGFSMLNLNRIYLEVLASNERARGLYAALGFQQEGVMRQAQYKNGRYLDVILMSLLREEYEITG